MDFIGSGKTADVYRYRLNNNTVAVKCFRAQKFAEEERDVFEEIKRVAF